jgi:hypothetical protein
MMVVSYEKDTIRLWCRQGAPWPLNGKRDSELEGEVGWDEEAGGGS